MEHVGDRRPSRQGIVQLSHQGRALILLDPLSDAGGVSAIASRAVTLTAIVLIAGSVVFHTTIVRRWHRSGLTEPANWNRIAATMGAWAAACLVLVAPARLYIQARALVDVTDPVMPMMANVLETTWGRAWAFQLLAGLVCFFGFALARRDARSRSGWRLALLSAMGLTVTPAFMGHAVAAVRLRGISLLADWIHVTSAGAWIGALGLVALLCRSLREDAAGDTMSAALIERFHPVALVSASTIVATGAVSVLLRVDHLVDLLHSTYGAILFVKLALTFAVAGLGAYHARQGATTARQRGPGAVVRSLMSEVAFALLVLITTAVLVGTSPPMDMR